MEIKELRDTARDALIHLTCVKKARTLKFVAEQTGIPYASLVKFRREKVLNTDRIITLLRWLAKEGEIKLPTITDWSDDDVSPTPTGQIVTVEDLAGMMETCLSVIRANVLDHDALVRLMRKNLRTMLESLSHI